MGYHSLMVFRSLLCDPMNHEDDGNDEKADGDDYGDDYGEDDDDDDVGGFSK